MKKLIFTVATVFGMAFGLQAQDFSFSHAAGASFLGGKNVVLPALTYSPRLNFMELSDDLILSVGTHASLGLELNSQSGGSYFGYNLPLLAEINWGHASYPDSDSDFGAFAGVGYGMSYLAGGSQYGVADNVGMGVAFSFGLRGMIREQSYGLVLGYMSNLTKASVDANGVSTPVSDIFSIGIQYNFGDF